MELKVELISEHYRNGKTVKDCQPLVFQMIEGETSERALQRLIVQVKQVTELGRGGGGFVLDEYHYEYEVMWTLFIGDVCMGTRCSGDLEKMANLDAVRELSKNNHNGTIKIGVKRHDAARRREQQFRKDLENGRFEHLRGFKF